MRLIFLKLDVGVVWQHKCWEALAYGVSLQAKRPCARSARKALG
jgi:hypothetical protein